MIAQNIQALRARASFTQEVPSSFENARHAPGFVELTAPKVGGRTALAAGICRECQQIVIAY